MPTLPEFFVMAFFASDATLAWGLTLLGVVVCAEVLGNSALYLAAARFGVPAFFETRMRMWVKFLVVHDERIILVNRVAPVLPLVGAFIAVMKWDVRRSLFYVFLGSAVKYSVLIVFVGSLFVFFEDRTTARNLTLIAIGAVIVVSLIQAQRVKHQHLGPVAARVAHLGEGSAAVAAAAPQGPEDAAPPEQARQQQEPRA